MIDSHAHIYSNNREIIDKINKLNYLKSIINVGIDRNTSEDVIKLSEQEEKFFAVIGVHPLQEGKISEIYDLYKKYESKKVVGIGETGLDKTKELDSQIIKFNESISLANSLKLPLVIHSNCSNNECIKILKGHKPKYGFMFHCFQPNLDALDDIMKMGGYISVGTPITRKNAKKSLEVIKKVNIDRLLIELDYPYMSDNPMIDGKNVFNKIKELRNMEYTELEEKLDENTKRLFIKMN